MKAAAQDQWKLLDLAQTDRRIAQAEHRRRTLPELAELKDLAVQRRTLAEEVVAKSTALSDAKMEQERIEGDLEPARARMERNQKTVDAGTITDHKALRGLTEEIEHLGRRISRLEDDELDAMQAVEDAERAHADADRRRIELDGHIRTVLASRDAGLKGIDDELSDLHCDGCARPRQEAFRPTSSSYTNCCASAPVWGAQSWCTGYARDAALPPMPLTCADTRQLVTMKWCDARNAIASWCVPESPSEPFLWR